MTYYLVDGALLLALVVTTVSVFMMRRELKRLRDHHKTYASALDETGSALVSLGDVIRDLNLQGLSTLGRLVSQVDAAREVLEQLQRANSAPVRAAVPVEISEARRKLG